MGPSNAESYKESCTEVMVFSSFKKDENITDTALRKLRSFKKLFSNCLVADYNFMTTVMFSPRSISNLVWGDITKWEWLEDTWPTIYWYFKSAISIKTNAVKAFVLYVSAKEVSLQVSVVTRQKLSSWWFSATLFFVFYI